MLSAYDPLTALARVAEALREVLGDAPGPALRRLQAKMADCGLEMSPAACAAFSGGVRDAVARVRAAVAASPTFFAVRCWRFVSQER